MGTQNNRDSLKNLYRNWFIKAGAGDAAFGVFWQMFDDFSGAPHESVDWDKISVPFESDLVPLKSVATSQFAALGKANLKDFAWIVLNGGIGTSMKMDRAKSLLPVKDGKSFLELLVGFVTKMRSEHNVGLPLVFMNSPSTRDDTLRELERLGFANPHGIDLDFVQNVFPRIDAESLEPFLSPGDGESFAPSGHGDIYFSLSSGGLLKKLLDRGVRWALVSNADNLGASPDPAILGYMVESGMEFMMEVTPRTPADVKGGTLVRNRGNLELLEIAQVPPEHRDDFSDIRKFPVFNTNSIWLDLSALAKKNGNIRLPVIVNRKSIRGRQVLQLESAMGAGISSFAKKCGMLVPRERFAPVKTTDDLLVRRSDVYEAGIGSPLALSPRRDKSLGPPVVRLDGRFYAGMNDFDLRFPHPLSLVGAREFSVAGDVRFGRNVEIIGKVDLANPEQVPMLIPDNARLEG